MDKIMLVLETSKHAFGIMGRCGSTTMIRRSRKTREQNTRTYEYFNELDKEKYVFLRNPISRWYSAEQSGMGIDPYHALPYMHNIIWDKVHGIVPFEDLEQYLPKGNYIHRGSGRVYKGNQPSSVLDGEMMLYHMWRKKKPVLTPEKFREIIKEWDT